MIKIEQGFNGQFILALPIDIIEQLRENRTAGSLIACMAGYFPHAFGHYCEREHGISGTHSLIYCAAGKGRVRIGDREYPISENMFFHIHPDVPHRFNADKEDPWTIYWLHFDVLEGDVFYRTLQSSAIDTVCAGMHEEIIHLFDKIMSLLERGGDMECLVLANVLSAHLIGALYHSRKYSDETGDVSQKSLIDLCEHYMIESLHKNLSLKELSERYGYSVSYLQRVFCREKGMPPKQYLIGLKMNRAKEYLVKSEVNITQLALRVGYSDPLHFSKLFKKNTGYSPTEYRSKFQKKPYVGPKL